MPLHLFTFKLLLFLVHICFLYDCCLLAFREVIVSLFACMLLKTHLSPICYADTAYSILKKMSTKLNILY